MKTFDRKFKLLKDLPDCEVGAIGYEDSGGIVFKTFTEKSDCSRARYISYPVRFCERRRDWFEEVFDSAKDAAEHYLDLRNTTDEYKEVMITKSLNEILNRIKVLEEKD